MNAEQITFLNLRHFPGVLSRDEAAKRMGYSPVEIDILVSGGRLTPLGKPKRNAKKVFATLEIERCIQDMDWLHRAQRTIMEYWEKKNRSRRLNPLLTSDAGEISGNFAARKRSRRMAKQPARATAEERDTNDGKSLIR